MKLFFKLFSLLCLLLTHFSAHGCWEAKERMQIDGFAELDNVLILSFKDAISCQPLANADVMLGELKYIADSRGYVKLPMDPFSQQMDAHMPISVSKPGYIKLDTELIIEAGIVLNRRQVLSPALPPGKVRFVLQWDAEPQDLDLHLKGPQFHISYRNMKNAPNRARLDVDEIDGYGPETITLDRVDRRYQYELWVYNYSNDEPYSGHELIYVYVGDRLFKEIRLPRGHKRSVKVLQIIDGSYQFQNTPTDQKP